jgi:hypothetical protein
MEHPSGFHPNNGKSSRRWGPRLSPQQANGEQQILRYAQDDSAGVDA